MKQIIIFITLVAFGGALGAICRYLAHIYITTNFDSNFPYSTLLVNVIGCFLIGIFMTIVTQEFNFDKTYLDHFRIFIVVGFLGSFTTFSSYGYETFQLLEQNNILHAALNICSNLFIGFFALWLGINTVKVFFKLIN